MVKFLGILFLLIIFSSSQVALASVTVPKSLKIAISSSPNNLNPFFSTDGNSQNINRLVHSSLTDFNRKMEFECVLCESFSEEIKDGKHYVNFKLKANLKFWDGTPITAKSVENAIRLFTETKKIKSVFRFAFSKIMQIEILGTLEFNLVYKKFDLENISNLSLLKILKLKNPNKKRVNALDLVGAGPYKIDYIKALEIGLSPSSQGEKRNLIFKVVRDETTLALKIINKEIDLSLANISPRKLNWLKNKTTKGLKIFEAPSSNYKYININHKRPHVNQVKFRKALSHLIPREDILNYKLKGTATLSNGMFSPAFSGLFNREEVDKFDPKKASKIFKELGYTYSKQGYLFQGKKAVSLDWKVTSNKSTLELVEIIKAEFEKAGLKVNTTIQEWGSFMRSFKKGDYDLILGQWVGFTGPDMLKFVFHSKSIPPRGGNRGHYKNSSVDSLLDEATSEVDKEKRNSLYKKVINIVNNDYSYINLWHPKIIWIGRDCLGEIHLQPNGSFFPILDIKKSCQD